MVNIFQPLIIKVHTFLWYIVMFVPEKSYECGRINNSLLATDHGTHYWWKCVIQWKPFMFIIWWTLQEIRHMNTTCNALEDGIWIADHVTISQSCMGIGRNNRSTWIGSLWGQFAIILYVMSLPSRSPLLFLWRLGCRLNVVTPTLPSPFVFFLYHFHHYYHHSTAIHCLLLL